MAVYPDRIILKNSTDSQAAIEVAIGTGGADEILYGELVIGRETGSAKLYTVDAAGAIVTISGGGSSSVIVSATPPTQRPDASPLEEGDLWWDSDDELLYVYIGSTWTLVSTSTTVGRGDGGDLDTGTVDTAFVFGVYGGGDLDTTTADNPIEFTGGVDGGEIT